VVRISLLGPTARRPMIGTIVLGAVVFCGQAGSAAAGTSAPATAGALPTVVAGERGASGGVTTQALTAADAPGLFAKAASTRDALGLPSGVAREGRHVIDRNQADEYDAVSELDAAGAPIVEIRFSPSGGLTLAVRLDRGRGAGTGLTASKASAAARRGLAAVGIAPVGAESVDADAVQGGWQIHWDRSQRGIGVRGDETRVHVLADGSIGSVARVDHPLAAEPERRIGSDAARRAVAACADTWFAGTESGYRLDPPALQWIEPNGLFDGSTPMASAAPYRLAWVIDLRPTGPAALSVGLVTVFVDAGDGSLLGGDVVQ